MPVHRPSDGVEIGRLHDAGETIVDEAVGAARDAFRTSGWARPTRSIARRCCTAGRPSSRPGPRRSPASNPRLRRAPIADTLGRDVGRAAGAIRFFAESVDKIEGSVIATAAAANCMVVPEPYGVVASITAWNFPLINAGVEVGAGSRRRQRGGAEAVRVDALHRDPHRRTRRRSRPARRPLQCRPRSRRDDRFGPGAPSGRPQDQLHRLDRNGARIMADAAATGRSR